MAAGRLTAASCVLLLLAIATLPVSVGARSALMLTGNDMDENGCIGSAGYSWCPALDPPACVRVWETPCPSAVVDNGSTDQTPTPTPTPTATETSTATSTATATPEPADEPNACQVAAPPMGICTADVNPCGFPSFCSCPEGFSYYPQLGPQEGCLLDGVRGFDEVVPGERESDECVVPIGANIGSNGVGRCTLDLTLCGGPSNCACPPGFKYASQIKQCLRGDL